MANIKKPVIANSPMEKRIAKRLVSNRKADTNKSVAPVKKAISPTKKAAIKNVITPIDKKITHKSLIEDAQYFLKSLLDKPKSKIGISELFDTSEHNANREPKYSIPSSFIEGVKQTCDIGIKGRGGSFYGVNVCGNLSDENTINAKKEKTIIGSVSDLTTFPMFEKGKVTMILLLDKNEKKRLSEISVNIYTKKVLKRLKKGDKLNIIIEFI